MYMNIQNKMIKIRIKKEIKYKKINKLIQKIDNRNLQEHKKKLKLKKLSKIPKDHQLLYYNKKFKDMND